MNILQGLKTDNTYCVTLNYTDQIDEGKILKTIQYDHPIFTPKSIIAQENHRLINGTSRTYYCGAYWRNGFHEDGVVSALNATITLSNRISVMKKSCLYVGQVRHRRFTPKSHQFSYKLFLVYLDLSELPSVFDRFWLWSIEKANIATFRRRDHLGDKSIVTG